MKGIRQPTLADMVLAMDPKYSAIDQKWCHKSLDQLRTAHKFVLDTQAATYLGEMIHDHPRIIADAQDFAIRPFDLMWVEMPFPPFYYAVSNQRTDPTGDQTVGYLFVGPTVKVASLSYSTAHGRFVSWFNPIEYVLHRPMSLEEEVRLSTTMKTSRLGLDLWFWGETADNFIPKNCVNGRLVMELESEEWDKVGLRSLRANHTVQIAPTRHPGNSPNPEVTMNGSGGELRNIIAILLFLNRTADVQYVRDVGIGQTIINRKPKPMLPHKVITLKLNPLPRLATLVAGSGIRRRLHDVRGHYCHDKRARAGCQHGTQTFGDWGEWWVEYEPLRWECSECKGHRWWRHEHHRGNSDNGVIKEQVYAVTK